MLWRKIYKQFAPEKMFNIKVPSQDIPVRQIEAGLGRHGQHKQSNNKTIKFTDLTEQCKHQQ